MTSTPEYDKCEYRIWRDESGLYRPEFRCKGDSYWNGISWEVPDQYINIVITTIPVPSHTKYSTANPLEAEEQCRIHATERLRRWKLAQNVGVYKNLGELP